MDSFVEKFKKFFDTPDNIGQYSKEDVEKNKVMAILSYCTWLVLIPIFAAKDSAYAKFHVNQGITIAIVELLNWAVVGALSRIVIIGFVFSILDIVINVVCLVFAIVGIYHAVNGQAKELPIIGKYRFIK